MTIAPWGISAKASYRWNRRNGFVTYGCASCCAFFGQYVTDFSGNVGDSGPVAYIASNDCNNQNEDQTSLSWG